ncbi:hypothetical protein FRC07_004454 [Ceratobasidium sp. 392]|nr:hypothetical protein FRC07_004454 [Ceratobasidium sp. 392]
MGEKDPPTTHRHLLSSLGQSSSYHSSTSHTRYPEPYAEDPFLPLKTLRHLRSNGQLAKSPPFRPLASATPSRRKPPPTLVLDDTAPVPLATSNSRANAPQGRAPEVEPSSAIRPVAEAIRGSSQFSRVNSHSSESDLASAYTCFTSPPAELYPATSVPGVSHVDTRSTHITAAELLRTTSITERLITEVSDIGPALRFMSDTKTEANKSESCRGSISESPGGNEADEIGQVIQEQNVAYDGIEGLGPIGKTGFATAKSQISAGTSRKDPHK